MLISTPMLAMLSGWELVLIFAVILILFGARNLPGLTRGLREGFFHFRKNLDLDAHAVGESVGGILGKPAAEALTPDNQTAELYDPAVFHREEEARRGAMRTRLRRWLRRCRSLWRSLRKRLKGQV